MVPRQVCHLHLHSSKIDSKKNGVVARLFNCAGMSMGSSLVSSTESRGQQVVLTTSLIAQAVNKSTDEVATATHAVLDALQSTHACMHIRRGCPCQSAPLCLGVRKTYAASPSAD